ncbi:NAD(P)-binding protein [Cylindrobasidium torrendii FP15055 ss-10]|uniref:NAD(P)-binding protein n=1 Tax=Cylindrobasidium torrendii FP15055 ss-10 TaxID=1314674 RepID=A0A0D7BF89_9AGAR|nr:NAD(P)-binding protein [Cylindrobasidium torrendii FP15055 ss-10]
MSSRSVAVLGYGTLGKPITHALGAEGAKVIVLSRDPSKLDLPAGVASAATTYDDEATLAKIFKDHNVDIIVSTLSEFGETQLVAARAGKAAGTVKLFVPSEFGTVTNGNKQSVFANKDRISETISKEIGIPTLRVYNGVFLEFLPYFTGATTHPGKVAILKGGKGQTKMSTTSIGDIAAFLAHVLVALPYSQLENIIVRLEGQGLTLQDVAKIAGRETVFVDAAELTGGSFIALLQGLTEVGQGRSSYDPTEPEASLEVIEARAGSGNTLWKEYKFKQVTPEIFNN